MFTYVLDTTLLSNFAHIQRPRLLSLALGEGITTTPIVMAELHIGEAKGFVPTCDWAWLSLLLPNADELRFALLLQEQLDPGEAECLAIAYLRGYCFLSDDFVARRLAHHYKVSVSGTLGVLLKLLNTKEIDILEADYLLGQMIQSGYRSPVRSLRDLMD